MATNSDNVIKVLVFDVYGTLLDMSDIKKKVNRFLDSKRGYVIWSEMLMHYCLVDNATTHHQFMDIARASLKMAAKTMDVGFTNDGFDEIMELFKHLPLQESTPEGLSALKDMNLRFTALTNFPLSIVQERMERTGLVSYFEKIISAESMGVYKPDKKAYEFAANENDTPTQNMLMITTHGWDISGALHAGMKTVYIEKGGELLFPLTPQPDYSAKNIAALANLLK